MDETRDDPGLERARSLVRRELWLHGIPDDKAALATSYAESARNLMALWGEEVLARIFADLAYIINHLSGAAMRAALAFTDVLEVMEAMSPRQPSPPYWRAFPRHAPVQPAITIDAVSAGRRSPYHRARRR